jgi:hypothetical protein
MRKPQVLVFLIATLLTSVVSFDAVAAADLPQGTCAPPGSWATRTPFPTPAVRAWGTFFPANGRFYLMGGRSSDVAGSDFIRVNEYDPILDSWAVKAGVFADLQVNNMVGGVLDFAGTPYIVTVGGSAAAGTTASSAVRRYDPVADAMTLLTSDPWPGNADGTTLPGGAAVHDNKLYVFGGFDIGIGMTSAIYEFDPAAAAGSRWSLKTASLPNPIGYIPVAASGAFIYLLGGASFDSAGGTLADTTESSRYDPVADAITPIAAIPRATGETRAVTQPGGSIWVLGGGRLAPNPTGEVDVYTPGTDAWTLGPSFATGRRNLAADVDPASGTIWATGGYDGANPATPLDVNEQFSSCVLADLIFADGFEGP